MDNYISYETRCQTYKFVTNICFIEGKPDESIALEVYQVIRKDCDERQASGEISPVLSNEELEKLSETEREKHKITNIKFVDYNANKKLCASFLYDCIESPCHVEPLLLNE